jgi:hypothetical protein
VSTATKLTAEDRARAAFEQDTADHVLSVKHDDGLYRHLRCGKPGTSVYRFDLVTWPGYLYVGGDVDDFVFARTPDMFLWFEAGSSDARGINPHYWAQKLQSPARRDVTTEYSSDKLKGKIREWLDERCEDLDAAEVASLRTAVSEELLSREELVDETAGLFLVRDFFHDGHAIYEPADWDLRDYTGGFLWACWAIVWAIREYRALKLDSAEGQGRR